MAKVQIGDKVKELSYIDLLTMLAQDVEGDQGLTRLDKRVTLAHIEALQDILFKYSY